MKAKIVLCTLVLVFIVQAVWAQIPKTNSYQDAMTDTGGTPFNVAIDVSDTLAADSLVIVKLYNDLDGPNWNDNTNWLSGEPISSWYGVSTDDSGRVTGLYLGENNLSSQLPSEIGNLTNLTELWLYTNQLTGTIPAEIGNLVNLTHLEFGNNQITGSIPTEIGNLTNLINLCLWGNQLTGSIPPEIGNLTDLTILDLCSNQLTGSIPPEIWNLANLLYLELDTNQLTGTIPPEIGNLVNLTFLSLGKNQLTSTIPTEIGNLTNLTNLKFGSNQLTGTIPPEIGNLTNLTQLGLYSNQLTGSIPPELWNLTNLTELYLYSNQLTGTIPPEIWNLTNLTRLELDQNQLTGTIPPEIGNLANLQYLYLNTNQLTGSIPPEIGNLVNLKYLYLHSNQLTGIIPPEIGNLTNLTNLNFRSNQLTGTIPPEIGNLTNLINLNLRTNQLTGTIPPEIGNLTNLEGLYLMFNQLTGTIPPEIGYLTELQDLRLLHNQLIGTIPPEIGNLTNLIYLNLRTNQFTGTIPPEIWNLVNLKSLYLHTNQLTGSIPSELGNLVNLQRLMLYNNQFTGSVPQEIVSLVNLDSLKLYNNQFTDLPDITALDTSLSVRVYDNKLTFEDIEPNVDHFGEFLYAPQDSVGSQKDTTAASGSSFTLSVSVGGTANKYQWTKNGIEVSGATDSSYTIEYVDASNTGTYICRITNTIVTDLTLYSRPFNVTSSGTHFQLYATNTGNYSNLMIPTTAAPTIEETLIENGDEIGVFTPGGLCMGVGVWESSNLAITVWGDDSNTPEVDGFQTGETYNFKIYDKSADTEFDAVAEYSSGKSTYFADDLPVLSSLSAVKPEINIPLNTGWNMISSNIIPETLDLDAVLVDVKSNMIIMKNGAGQVYWPEYSVNQIGNWAITDGYKVAMTTSDTLTITGTQADVSSTSFSLVQGWSIISYLPTSPMSCEAAFSSIISKLIIVKNNDGQVYWPQYSVNQIGNLEVGEGYWMAVNEATVFTYPLSAMKIIASKEDDFSLSKSGSSSQVHFVFTANTGNNATIMVQTSINPTINGVALSAGDEIGVFTPSGLCAGAGLWDGTNNLAITVWEDDTNTASLIDGFQTGEAYSFRIWDASFGIEYSASASASVGDLAYSVNGITVLSSLTAASTAINELVEQTVNSDSGTVGVQFADETFLKLKFNSGNISGKTVKIMSYGSTAPDTIPTGDNFQSVIGYYDISSDSITTFTGTLTFGYTNTALNTAGISENDLSIAYYNTSESKWQALATTVNSSDSIASAEIDHFSIWALTDKNDALILGIKESEDVVKSYKLFSNYPNPFNPETTIQFQIPRLTHVTLKIYNILGEEVKTLVSQNISSGTFTVRWDGTDNYGRKVSSGVYIYIINTNTGFVKSRKMLYIK